MKNYQEFQIDYFQDEDGMFTARVPAIRGCVAWGKKLEEAYSNAVDAIESCLEALEAVKAAQAHVEYDDAGSSHIVVRITPVGRCKSSAMLDHCAKKLAPHKVPRRIEIAE